MKRDMARTDWRRERPDLDTTPMELVFKLKQCSALVGEALGPVLEGAPLSSPELDLLVPLRHAAEPVIGRSLAVRLGVSHAAISKTLSKLEKRGFVTREANPADKRASLVVITEAGKDVIDEYFPRQLEVEAAMLDGLGEERAGVLEALDHLIGSLRDYVEPGK